jgi:hypothetical protein
VDHLRKKTPSHALLLFLLRTAPGF